MVSYNSMRKLMSSLVNETRSESNFLKYHKQKFNDVSWKQSLRWNDFRELIRIRFIWRHACTLNSRNVAVKSDVKHIERIQRNSNSFIYITKALFWGIERLHIATFTMTNLVPSHIPCVTPMFLHYAKWISSSLLNCLEPPSLVEDIKLY